MIQQRCWVNATLPENKDIYSYMWRKGYIERIELLVYEMMTYTDLPSELGSLLFDATNKVIRLYSRNITNA